MSYEDTKDFELKWTIEQSIDLQTFIHNPTKVSSEKEHAISSEIQQRRKILPTRGTGSSQG